MREFQSSLHLDDLRCGGGSFCSFCSTSALLCLRAAGCVGNVPLCHKFARALASVTAAAGNVVTALFHMDALRASVLHHMNTLGAMCSYRTHNSRTGHTVNSGHSLQRRYCERTYLFVSRNLISSPAVVVLVAAAHL